MSLPLVWARLPGPADFLDTVLEDLIEHTAVLAGLPVEIPNRAVALEFADLVKHHRLGKWEIVRSNEARTTSPSDSIARRFGGGRSTRSVLWVDATIEDSAAAAWAEHARRTRDVSDMPRLCVAMNSTCAEACEEEKQLRRRLWRDFVTPLDSRALVERISRRAGHQPPHIALKSALIAAIAGADLAYADRLSQVRLGRIFQNSEHSREHIWAAQVSVLLPLVERERQRLLHAHRALWRLPYTRKDGTEIHRLHDLEIGDMASQARRVGPLGHERKNLGWLRTVRNALAHNEVVPWATLTSPVAVQLMDFR